jgi:hypothetical protein
MAVKENLFELDRKVRMLSDYKLDYLISLPLAVNSSQVYSLDIIANPTTMC